MKLGMMTYIWNSSTWGAEAEGLLWSQDKIKVRSCLNTQPKQEIEAELASPSIKQSKPMCAVSKRMMKYIELAQEVNMDMT